VSSRAKFRANLCNNKRGVGDKLNSRWRRPPSWIYYYCQFWSCDLFFVVAGYNPAEFH